MEQKSYRSALAHFFMVLSIILVGFGVGIINPGAGVAAAGLASGAYGYLLGAE